MNTTSLRAKPALASASKIQSSMGRPMTSTRVFGMWSVLWPRRLPRPAPITIARTSASLSGPPNQCLLLAQLGEHIQIFEGGNVPFGLAAGGNVLQQPAHDLAAAGFGKVLRETHGVRSGEFADLVRDVLAQRFLHFRRRSVGRLEGHEHDQRLALQVVGAPDRRRLCDRRVRYERALD